MSRGAWRASQAANGRSSRSAPSGEPPLSDTRSPVVAPPRTFTRPEPSYAQSAHSTSPRMPRRSVSRSASVSA